MMLKLMAMMRGGNGGQGSMDPGAFLAAASRRAQEDAEHAEQMRKARATKRDAEDKGRRAKQQGELEEAEHNAQVAVENAEQDVKMAELGLQAAGVKGVVAEKQAEANRLKKKTEETEAKQELEGLKRKFNEAAETIENLKNYTEWTHVPAEFKTKMNIYVALLLNFGNHISQLGSKITDIDKVNVKIEEINKMENELRQMQGLLIRDLTSAEFAKEQLEDQYNTKHETVREYRELEKQLYKKQRDVELMKERVNNAGLIFDTDENGDLIETQRDHEKMPEIEPDQDEQVMKHKTAMNDIIDHLKNRVRGQRKDGISWEKVLKINPDPRFQDQSEKELWAKAMKRFTSVGTAEDVIITGINDMETQGGRKKISLPELVQIYQEQSKLCDKRYVEAQKRFDEAAAYNAEIDKLPKYSAKPVTAEMNAKLKSEIDSLQKQQDQLSLKESLIKEMTDKLVRLSYEKKQKEAELNQMKENEASDADIQEKAKELAKVEHEIGDLQRDIKKLAAKQQKVDDLEAQTEGMEFDNKVMQSRVDETEDAKKAREDAEDEAIKAHMEAERQKELLEAKNMTHKSEQEARQAEFELNEMNSEKIRSTNEKIAKAKAKAAYHEYQKQQTEALINAKQTVRNKVIESKAVGFTDAMIDRNMDYNNAVGQLTAMAGKIEQKTGQIMQDKEYIEQKGEELYRRFKDNSDLQYAVIKDVEGRQGKKIDDTIFNSREAFKKSINSREAVDDMESYFNTVMKPPSTPPSMPPPPRSDYPPPPGPGYVSMFEVRPTYQQPPRFGEPPSAGYLPPRPKTPPASSNNRFAAKGFFAPMKPPGPGYDNPPYIDSSDDEY
jgi:hypothetical protein